MSAARRGFLALVGGALLGGAVQRRAGATTPTLILPAALVPVASLTPLLDAAHDRGDSTMHVFLDCGRRMPRPAFREWMEDGMRRSMLFDPPDAASEQRRIQVAVAQHGSMVAAVQAGAL